MIEDDANAKPFSEGPLDMEQVSGEPPQPEAPGSPWPSEFRFLVLCRGASRREEDGWINLLGIVDTVATTANAETPLAAIVGAVLRKTHKGKSLDLMAWQLDRNGKRRPIPGYAGTPLVLPDWTGPAVLPFSIAARFPETGIYGFDLFDRDGAFAPPGTLLATYLFAALATNGDEPPQRPNAE